MIASGVIHPGDRIQIQLSGMATTVARIVTLDGDLESAVAGQSVTLTLTDELDVSRGDLLSAADSPAEIADQFEAKVVWMSAQPLLPDRRYLIKIGSLTVPVHVRVERDRMIEGDVAYANPVQLGPSPGSNMRSTSTRSSTSPPQHS